MPFRLKLSPGAIAALLFISLLPGCGDQGERGVTGLSPEPSPRPAESHDSQQSGTLVVIENHDSSSPGARPALVAQVEPGGRVIWENRDSKDHSITSPVGLWDSGRIRPGERFEKQFSDPGEFSFISVFDREVSGTVYSAHSARGGNPAEGALVPDELTVENASVPYQDLESTLVPEWPSATDLDQAFRLIHEERILQNPGGNASEDRRVRLPWNFIEDGCAPRAAIAAQLIEARGWRRPAKLFAFGTLALEREGGTAFWWYHVALVVRVGGDPFVLDPAVEPTRALGLADWLSRIAWPDPASVTVSICNAFAYEPGSSCYVSGPEDESGALDEVLLYLPPQAEDR